MTGGVEGAYTIALWQGDRVVVRQFKEGQGWNEINRSDPEWNNEIEAGVECLRRGELPMEPGEFRIGKCVGQVLSKEALRKLSVWTLDEREVSRSEILSRWEVWKKIPQRGAFEMMDTSVRRKKDF